MSRLVAFVFVTVLLGALGASLMSRTTLKPESCLRSVRHADQGRFATVIQQQSDSVLIEYEDELRLRVPRGPRKIVSTLPGITELVAYLGAVERLVAVSPHCDTPPRVARLPTISVQPLDIEALLEKRPDLIILDRRLHRPAIVEARRRVGNVLLLDTSRSLAHLRTSIDLLARVLDTTDAAERANEWQRSLQSLEIELTAQRVVPAPRVLVVAQWEPLYVMGPGSLLDDLVRACGCVNVACDLKSGASGPFSEELILERKPDWIFVPAGEMPDRLRTRWVNVPAVAQDRFLDASTDDVVRGGPRILEGLESIAAELLGDGPR